MSARQQEDAKREELEAEVERLRHQLDLAQKNVQSNGQAYEEAMDEVERLKYETKAARDRCFKLMAEVERVQTKYDHLWNFLDDQDRRDFNALTEEKE